MPSHGKWSLKIFHTLFRDLNNNLFVLVGDLGVDGSLVEQ